MDSHNSKQNVDSGKSKQQSTLIHRYITALALMFGFIIIATFLDKTIIYVILKYFPTYSQYALYVYESFNAIFGIVGIYIIYKLLISAVNARERGKTEKSNLEVIKVVLRVLFYFAVISIILYAYRSSLNINLGQVLAGGAIGGIIIGLAVQTIATSILSGFLLSSSRTLVADDALIMHSSVWGGDMLCRVISVNVLFTEVYTQNGNRMKLPNTVLMSNATFTKLRSGDCYSYPIQVVINADVPAAQFDKMVRDELRKNLSKLEKQIPKIYLVARGQTSYTFNAILGFNRFDEINETIDIVNKTFDDVYWKIKNQPATTFSSQPPKKSTRKRK
jgi:small-conductance mechanosensitive channel